MAGVFGWQLRRSINRGVANCTCEATLDIVNASAFAQSQVALPQHCSGKGDAESSCGFVATSAHKRSCM